MTDTPLTPKPYKDNLLTSLKSCTIFHFAGHGVSDPFEPSESRLCLQDWQENPLTVGDLRELKLHETRPWLGYLSACSTSQIQAEKLVDESIHEVSTCQIAGFRQVAAKLFYDHLSRYERIDLAISAALHFTVRNLRDRAKGKRAAASEGSVWPNNAGTGTDEGQILNDDDDGISGNRAAFLRRVGYNMATHWVPYLHFGA
ncbi:CHAT domain-containing protein [Nemania abortiva]|nr:CHAT domain-containing protein [Nemania abortiva]